MCFRLLLLTPVGEGDRKWSAEKPHIGGVGRPEPGGGGLLRRRCAVSSSRGSHDPVTDLLFQSTASLVQGPAGGPLQAVMCTNPSPPGVVLSCLQASLVFSLRRRVHQSGLCPEPRHQPAEWRWGHRFLCQGLY